MKQDVRKQSHIDEMYAQQSSQNTTQINSINTLP